MITPNGGLEVFRTLWARDPEIIARAPGRVNLIGEHIDYLGGTTLPIAIKQSVQVLIGSNGNPFYRFFSRQHPEDGVVVVTQDSIRVHPELPWMNYPLGVLNEFFKLAPRVEMPGFDMILDGDVPPGSGLSSSAAIEVATVFALNLYANTELNAKALALLCQRAENKFVGVPCGIMDQAASACCRADHALMLDTSTDPFTTTQIPVPAGISFVVAHCGIPRRLGGTKYGDRVHECASALAAINSVLGTNYRNLCGVPLNAIESNADLMASRFQGDNTLLKRARYAAGEQTRVLEFVDALRESDFSRAGNLMNESHFGLRDLYEVSVPELDELTGIARQCKGAFGSRLTGAGFGGCAITLVDEKSAQGVIDSLITDYFTPRGIEPLIFETRPGIGAEASSLIEER